MSRIRYLMTFEKVNEAVDPSTILIVIGGFVLLSTIIQIHYGYPLS